MKNRNKLLAALLAALLVMSLTGAAFADSIISSSYKLPKVKQHTDQSEAPAEEKVPEPEKIPETETAPAEEKHETPEGEPENRPESETEAPEIYYEFERDENGELILDELGDPIAIVPEGCEIPVKFERDEEGNLILDENGNPVILESVPAGSTHVDNWVDNLNPDRHIKTYLATKGPIHYGDTVEFIAVLYGYDNATYELRWQQTGADGEWYDLPGETDLSLFITVTEENAECNWHICVDIYDAAA